MIDYTKTHVELDHKHDSPLLSCRCSRTKNVVFFGAEDYSVWRWDWGQDKKVTLPTDAWVRGIAISPDDQTVITGGFDGRLIWWPAHAEQPAATHTIEAHDGWARAVDISPDGKLVASVGNDHVVRIWDFATAKLVKELSGDESKEDAIAHRSHVYNVVFHPNGKSLVTGDLMGQLIEWDLESSAAKRVWTAETLSKYDKGFRAQIGGFRTLRFNADGSKLFASGITNVTNAFAGVGNPSIVEFNWADNKQLVEYLSKPQLQGVAWGMVLHPDGPIIGAHGGSGGSLMFWKPGEAESAHQLKLPQNARDLDLVHDHERLAVACSDGHLRVCLMNPKKA